MKKLAIKLIILAKKNKDSNNLYTFFYIIIYLILAKLYIKV